MPEEVSIYLNGTPLRVPSGASVAAAILVAGESSFRSSVRGERRGPLCGMGTCFECRATVNGRRNCRTCQMAVEDEMIIETG
jgi:D-hydroxyproline dehydrogenase subunit gamma